MEIATLEREIIVTSVEKRSPSAEEVFKWIQPWFVIKYSLFVVLFTPLGWRSLPVERGDRSQNRQSILHQHSHRADAVAASRRAGSRGVRHGLVRPRRSWRCAVHRVRPSKRAVPKASCAEASGMDRGEPLAARGQQRIQHLVRSVGGRQLVVRNGARRASDDAVQRSARRRVHARGQSGGGGKGGVVLHPFRARVLREGKRVRVLPSHPDPRGSQKHQAGPGLLRPRAIRRASQGYGRK